MFRSVVSHLSSVPFLFTWRRTVNHSIEFKSSLSRSSSSASFHELGFCFHVLRQSNRLWIDHLWLRISNSATIHSYCREYWWSAEYCHRSFSGISLHLDATSQLLLGNIDLTKSLSTGAGRKETSLVVTYAIDSLFTNKINFRRNSSVSTQLSELVRRKKISISDGSLDTIGKRTIALGSLPFDGDLDARHGHYVLSEWRWSRCCRWIMKGVMTFLRRDGDLSGMIHLFSVYKRSQTNSIFSVVRPRWLLKHVRTSFAIHWFTPVLLLVWRSLWFYSSSVLVFAY